MRTVLCCIVRFESLVRLIPVLQAEQDASHARRLARIAATSQPTHTGCSNWEPWAQGWGFNAGSQMSHGSEKPGPPRAAILKRSSHPFPREVLIIDGRAAKASRSCLTDRHRKAQGARIRRRTGRWRRPGR